MTKLEKDIETVACRMVGMNEQHALEAWTNMLRLARLGAAVEAMPKGWLLEREDWSDYAWNCHKGARGPETTLQATSQAALDDMQRLLKITE